MSNPSGADFEGWVEVPGGRLWAQAAGAGTGVVLVHAGIADNRMWDPQWPALTAAHRVARYDVRRYGRSESDDVDYSDRVDLLAVMDAAGMDRGTLVGASLGGSIALDTAVEHPDRVAGLVWVCGGLGGLEVLESVEERALGERWEALAEAEDWAAQADLAVTIWVDGIGQPAGRAPEAARELVWRMCFETHDRAKGSGRPIALEPPAAARLDEVHAPTLAITGGLDTRAVGAMADALMVGVADAYRIHVPDVAHLPSLERPDWFNRSLLEFLSEVH